MEKCHPKPTVQTGPMEFPDPKNLMCLEILVQVLNLNLPAVPQNYVKFYLDHFSLNNVS